MSIAVVTPTTGHRFLADAIASVGKQTVPVDHYLFVDGPEHAAKAAEVTRNAEHLLVCQLPRSTGGQGFNGHRIYAAASYLIDAEYVFFLDEDNWFEPEHVETCVDLLRRHDLDWAYSLRNIAGEHGEILCHDDCDSLGLWGNYCDGRAGFVDTSCFAFTRHVLITVGHAWHNPRYAADWEFSQVVKDAFPRYGCTGRYTSCYRLHGSTRARLDDWFGPGNQRAAARHPRGFPWTKEAVNKRKRRRR